MKILSVASMFALFLGGSATMHSTTANAEIDGCLQLQMECNQGNQHACYLYKIGGCEGKATQTAIPGGTSPEKSNRKSDTIP